MSDSFFSNLLIRNLIENAKISVKRNSNDQFSFLEKYIIEALGVYPFGVVQSATTVHSIDQSASPPVPLPALTPFGKKVLIKYVC